MNVPVASFNRAALFSAGKRKVLENFFAISSLQAANFILPLFTLPYLIRVLGPEKYGLISFAGALIGYFGMFADYGFNLSATQEISVHRDDAVKTSEIFSAVLLIKAALVLCSILILGALLVAVPRFKEYAALYIFTFGIVIGNALFPAWFFQGIEKMKYITFFNVVAKLIFTVAIFLVVREPQDFIYVPLLNSAGFIVAGIVGLAIAVNSFGMRLRVPSAAQIKYQLSKGWHVFISMVSISAYTSTRIFAVGLLTNNVMTGYYALAEKLMGIVQTMPLGSLIHAVYPRMSSLYAQNPERGYRIMRKLQRYTMLGSLVVLPLVFLLAPWIVLVVTGSAYHETILVFRLLLIALFFINSNVFRVQFLLISAPPRVYSRMHIIVGVLGIILTFLATYWFSYLGTAAVIIIIELLMLLMTMKNLKTSYQGAAT
jgi:PST family polysaccharide transporter